MRTVRCRTKSQKWRIANPTKSAGPLDFAADLTQGHGIGPRKNSPARRRILRGFLPALGAAWSAKSSGFSPEIVGFMELRVWKIHKTYKTVIDKGRGSRSATKVGREVQGYPVAKCKGHFSHFNRFRDPPPHFPATFFVVEPLRVPDNSRLGSQWKPGENHLARFSHGFLRQQNSMLDFGLVGLK